MKIKHLAFLLMAVICMTFVSCGSDEVKNKLNGTWESSTENLGDGASAVYSFVFDAVNMNGQYKFKVSMDEFKDYCIIAIPFTWTLTDDSNITFIMDTDSQKVSFSQEFEDQAKAENYDLNELSKELRSQTDKEISTLSGVKIVSLDDNTLKLNADGNLTTYTRE